MITSASEFSEFDIEESPKFERMRRGSRVIMPTRSGGHLHSHRAKAKARKKVVRATHFPGAHQRRRKTSK